MGLDQRHYTLISLSHPQRHPESEASIGYLRPGLVKKTGRGGGRKGRKKTEERGEEWEEEEEEEGEEILYIPASGIK